MYMYLYWLMCFQVERGSEPTTISSIESEYMRVELMVWRIIYELYILICIYSNKVNINEEYSIL